MIPGDNIRNSVSFSNPLIALVVLMGVLTTACDAGISTQEHLERAQALENKNDFRAAVVEYKAALQKAPENVDTRWALGQTYLHLGDGASAEKELRYARKNGKQGDEVVFALARALLLQREYQKALDTLQEAGQLSSSSEGLVIQGEAYIGMQKIPEAGKSFGDSLTLNAKNAEAYRGLAKVAVIGKNLDEANRRLDQALALSDRDAQSWMLKGEVALSKRDSAKAEEYFTKALQIDDNSFSTRVGLTRALLEQNKIEEAKKHIAFLTENLPNNPLVNYLFAVAAKQSNELAEAKGALLRVRNVQPDHLPSMLLLGSVHYLLKEFDQAAQELRRYLTKDPDHLSARKLLAASELKRNAPGSAIEVLTPAEKAHPADVQLLSMLGNAHIAKGNFSLGMTYLEKASALAPDAKEIRLRLASGQLAKGDPDKAIAELTAVIDTDPDFLQAEVMLGLIHLRRGEFDKTMEAAQRILDKKPDNPLPYNLMAAAYEGKKDLPNARDNYEKALSVAANYTPAMLNLARLDLQANDPASARQRFDSVLKVEENNVQALLGLAKIAKDERRYQDALQLLERASWHNPGALQPRLILAEVYLQEGNANKALRPITEASRLAPRNTRVLLLLGQSQLASGDQKAGLETFRKLIELDPDSPDTHFRYSVAQLANQDVEGAKASLEQALTLDANHLRSQIALANLELQAGNSDAAARIAQELKNNHPKKPAGYVVQGDLLMQQQRTAQAVSAYKTAYAIAPNRALLLKLFNAETASGNSVGAMEHLRFWIDDNPNDVPIRLALAQTLYKAENTAAAAAEYEQVLEVQPSNMIALNNLAGLYMKTNSARALELAKQAHDQAPERPEVLDTYGWILVNTGDVQQGLRILKTAVLGAPKNLDIRYHLAAARAQAGEREQAQKDLQALISDGKPFAEREAATMLLKELQKR